MSDIGLFEAMYSARALRRLKPDPVPEEIITKILDAAIRAPSAGNSQHWVFVVVRDPELRRELGTIYRKASDIAKVIYQARARPEHMTEEQYQRMMSSGAYLWEHVGEAPVLLVPCLRDRAVPPRESLPPAVQLNYEEEVAYSDRIRGASIYPAVQNIILACRAFGLASCPGGEFARRRARARIRSTLIASWDRNSTGCVFRLAAISLKKQWR